MSEFTYRLALRKILLGPVKNAPCTWQIVFTQKWLDFVQKCDFFADERVVGVCLKKKLWLWVLFSANGSWWIIIAVGWGIMKAPGRVTSGAAKLYYFESNTFYHFPSILRNTLWEIHFEKYILGNTFMKGTRACIKWSCEVILLSITFPPFWEIHFEKYTLRNTFMKGTRACIKWSCEVILLGK